MTMTGPLSRLERMDVHDAWPGEASDFTPWLATDENILLLGETIGVELEVESTERNVGPFRADILCKEKGSPTEHWVLIENQLGRTDHTHLGQLLTYASGLHAVTIVWVAAQFAEEHRASVDWLNEITDERFRFYGLEIELWRIASSLPAPKFNVVSAPNEVLKPTRTDGDLGETRARQHAYWNALREHLKAHDGAVRMGKPRPQSWVTFAIGRTGIWMSATMNTLKNWIGVELTLGHADAKAFFHLLQEDKEAIESAFGGPLEWQELPEKKSCRIAIYKHNTDPLDEADWPTQHPWMADKLERLNKVFRERVRRLDAGNWQPNEDASDFDLEPVTTS